MVLIGNINSPQGLDRGSGLGLSDPARHEKALGNFRAVCTDGNMRAIAAKFDIVSRIDELKIGAGRLLEGKIIASASGMFTDVFNEMHRQAGTAALLEKDRRNLSGNSEESASASLLGAESGIKNLLTRVSISFTEEIVAHYRRQNDPSNTRRMFLLNFRKGLEEAINKASTFSEHSKGLDQRSFGKGLQGHRPWENTVPTGRIVGVVAKNTPQDPAPSPVSDDEIAFTM